MERTGSIKDKTVSIDLLEERRKCDFDQKELTSFIYDPRLLKNYTERQKIVENDPLLRGTEKFYDMSREELMDLMQRKAKRLAELGTVQKFLDIEGMELTHWQLSQGVPPIGLHVTMFSLGMKNLPSEEQFQRWGEKVRKIEDMIGTYAQTELGHGSNVQGLETTATFDKDTDEFIIHSPTLSSIKYWPGDSGLHANTAIVYAQMIIDGKKYGVQPFLVQTKDYQTHISMPGVQGGDLGPKFGYHSKENGWIRFDHVRIPRTNLMMRYIEVDREGNFKKIGDLRNLYSVMLETRVEFVADTTHFLSKALTIALRYSVVRRQFSTYDVDKKERKLLDYQTQMHKLAPLLAYTFGFIVSARMLIDLLYDLKEKASKSDFALLDITHHLTSGFKSLYTQITYDGLRTIREACGRSGFSAWSGLPYLQQLYAPTTTFEGDNTLMAQQCARLLMKTFLGLKKGVRAEGYFEYLNEMEGLLKAKCQVLNSQQLQDNEMLEEALKIRALHEIKNTMLILAKNKAPQNEKINSLFGIQIVNMTHLHVRYLLFRIMKDEIKKTQFKDPNVKGNLNLILTLLGVYEISTDNKALYECGYFQSGMRPIINQALKEIYKKLRPQMIPIVESFMKSDSELTSAIGNSYGDIYETQFEWAKNSSLNKQQVLPAIKEHILPILQGKL